MRDKVVFLLRRNERIPETVALWPAGYMTVGKLRRQLQRFYQLWTTRHELVRELERMATDEILEYSSVHDAWSLRHD